jgi:hypothetical protein
MHLALGAFGAGIAMAQRGMSDASLLSSPRDIPPLPAGPAPSASWVGCRRLARDLARVWAAAMIRQPRRFPPNPRSPRGRCGSASPRCSYGAAGSGGETSRWGCNRRHPDVDRRCSPDPDGRS